jgi:hypothetical protein
MTTAPQAVGGRLRNTGGVPDVQGTMSTVRTAFPYVRALILAIVVTALIMVGLPALLTIASAASL